LRECPAAYITGDIRQTISLAGLYEKGLPPIAGGSLDQAVAFIAAAEFIWREEKQYKVEQWPNVM